MCTPPTANHRKQMPMARVSGPDLRNRSAAPRPARCRWIDDQGQEWVFTREGGTLLVERPARVESVMIRFPDLPSSGTSGTLGEAWVLFCTADGHLFHCSVCREIGLMEFPKSEGPAGGVRDLNTHVRTFLEPEDCGCAGPRSKGAGFDGEAGR